MTEHELREEIRKLDKRIKKLEEWLDIFKDNQQVQMGMIFKLQQQLGVKKDEQ